MKRAESLACFAHSVLLNASPSASTPSGREKIFARIERAWRLQPDHPEIAFSYGLALKERGRHGEALAIFRELLALCPDEPLVYFQALSEAFETQRFDLFSDYARFLVQREKNPKDLALFAVQTLVGNHCDREAILLLDTFRGRCEPIFWRTLLHEIILALLDGNGASSCRARLYITPLLKSYTPGEKGQGAHAASLILLGRTYVAEKAYREAWRAIREAWRVNPTLLSGFEIMGAAYAGDPEAFSGYMEEPPFSSFERGIVSATVAGIRGKTDEQIARLNRTLEGERKAGHPPCEAFFTLFADLLLTQKRGAEALELFREGVESHPDSLVLKNGLAYFLALEGRDLGLANLLCNETLRVEPHSAAYLDTKAWILYRSGRPYEAVQGLTMALSIERDREIQEHLREVLLSLGKVVEARLIPRS